MYMRVCICMCVFVRVCENVVQISMRVVCVYLSVLCE